MNCPRPCVGGRSRKPGPRGSAPGPALLSRPADSPRDSGGTRADSPPAFRRQSARASATVRPARQARADAIRRARPPAGLAGLAVHVLVLPAGSQASRPHLYDRPATAAPAENATAAHAQPKPKTPTPATGTTPPRSAPKHSDAQAQTPRPHSPLGGGGERETPYKSAAKPRAPFPSPPLSPDPSPPSGRGRNIPAKRSTATHFGPRPPLLSPHFTTADPASNARNQPEAILPLPTAHPPQRPRQRSTSHASHPPSPRPTRPDPT